EQFLADAPRSQATTTKDPEHASLAGSSLAAMIAAMRAEQNAPKRRGKKAAVSKAAPAEELNLNDGFSSSLVKALGSTSTGKTQEEKAVKLATGRSSSSTKEKRIREALAKQKEERDAQKQEQIKREKAEMDAILANINSREKESRQLLRKRRNSR
ncbi:hypothetical protein ACKC9G_02990, partial [Pokkaliibacter sp. CJK22405]